MSQYDPNNPYGQNQQSPQGMPQYMGAQAAAQQYAHPMFAADASQSERTAFIQRTYLHLGGAILTFVLLATLALNVIVPMVGAETVIRMFSGWNMLILLGAFIGVSFLAEYWARSGASPAMQYAGLGLYVFAEAIIFTPLLLIASMFYPGAIETAGIATLAIFGSLTAFVFISKADFSFMRGFLVVASMAAFAVIIASMFWGGGLGIWFSGAMILLFAGYILYDTSNVLHHYRTDQHVSASLALFASVAMLFWYVLRFVMAMMEE